jgi:hypothetical protein
MHCFVALSALVAIAWAEPVNAQQVKAGVLTCDVSEGMGSHAAGSWCGQSSRTQLPVPVSSLASMWGLAAK